MPRRGLAIEELFEEFETPHSSLMAATASAIASSSGRSAHDLVAQVGPSTGGETRKPHFRGASD
jgi:hypothetical protein